MRKRKRRKNTSINFHYQKLERDFYIVSIPIIYMNNKIMVVLAIVLVLIVSGCASDTRTPRDELFMFFNNAGKAAYVADFVVLGDGQPIISGYKKYSDGQGNYRFDSESEEGQARTYIMQDKGYVCLNIDGSWTCEETASVALTYLVMPEQAFGELKNYADELIEERIATQNIA
ncbi:MAG: hypothetical protein JSW41_00005, partial [Candidatus Aenigmatarchaeota archaeon]